MPTTATTPTTRALPETRIALVDDHALVRMGYRRLLEMEPGLRIVAEYATVDAALAELVDGPGPAVDLVLLDLSMPGRSGLELLRALQGSRPALKVIVVTMHASPALLTQSLRAGALGFVSKSDDPQQLVDLVLRLAAGQAQAPLAQQAVARAVARDAPHSHLTARENEVFLRLLTGAGLEDIAQQLGVSEKTVSNYQTLIRQKLDVGTAVELLHYGRTHGLMP